MNDAATTATGQSTLPECPKRRGWLIALAGVLIFVCGCLVGGGIALVAARHAVIRAADIPARTSDLLASRLQRRLSLTDEQRRTVEGIIARHQESLATMRREYRPRVDAELEAIRTEVAAVLTPEQGRLWDRLYERTRHFWLGPPPEPMPRHGMGPHRRPPPPGLP